MKEVQDTWYLVNCVDNNFLSGDLYASLSAVGDQKAKAKGA